MILYFALFIKNNEKKHVLFKKNWSFKYETKLLKVIIFKTYSYL